MAGLLDDRVALITGAGSGSARPSPMQWLTRGPGSSPSTSTALPLDTRQERSAGCGFRL